MRVWWSEKYQLPTNHPLFEGLSPAELISDMYEDLMLRRQRLEHDLSNGKGAQADVNAAIRALNGVLGDRADVNEDDLIDKWEAELEAGILPDLNEQG